MSSQPEIADSPNQLTIEQLAAETGMSVRNIRAHQARGLLAPPEVRMRVGYYGPDHVAQLRLIRELQHDGFNLNGIKRLLDDSEDTAQRLMAFRRALSAAAEPEAAQTLTLAELGSRFRVGPADAPAVLARAQELGVLRRLSDDLYEVPSPSLLALAEEVAGQGVSVYSALDVLEEVKRHVDSVSRTFVETFIDQVWKPFAQADMPAERWPEIERAVRRLAPIANEALIAIFRQRLGRELEESFLDVARRTARRGS
ncbi:MAG TPA: MerR family transcriptional regulator [Solirubrobacteraceae bacterium]|nr:MerR family transcriptional regulator [Solirubrobacteraceae bacterium]